MKKSTVLKCIVMVNSFMIVPSFVKIIRLVKTQKCLLTCTSNKVLSKFALFCVIKTNLTHYLSSVYFVSQPLHVSGIFVAHHQEVCCIYTTIGTCWAFQLTVCWPAGRPTDTQLKSTTCTNCCIYTAYLLMMGYKYARNV